MQHLFIEQLLFVIEVLRGNHKQLEKDTFAKNGTYLASAASRMHELALCLELTLAIDERCTHEDPRHLIAKLNHYCERKVLPSYRQTHS
jgi:hypothetical protein